MDARMVLSHHHVLFCLGLSNLGQLLQHLGARQKSMDNDRSVLILGYMWLPKSRVVERSKACAQRVEVARGRWREWQWQQQ